MSLIDRLQVDATSYPYQKERADALTRVLTAIILDAGGRLRISACAREAVAGPLSDYTLTTQQDPRSGDWIVAVEKRP